MAVAPATRRSSPASSASPPWSAPAPRPETLADGRDVTVSCAEGDTGFVYDGLLDFRVERTELSEMPDIPVKIMMNVGTPDQAFAFARLPHRGIGLARLEFIINRQIGIHPKALLDLERTRPPTR